jgi:cyclomaltodextrinase
MTVPDWVRDAVFYQIFPDRFADGDPTNNPPNVQPWGAPPNIWDFQGGDLAGIIQRFDYLLDLGVTALYLNPIFLSTSNHRYNTTDYYRIDPKLGELDDFDALIQRAHHHGVRVILDGVFNHCGRGFFAFNDLLENQEHSPFQNWFHVRHFPIDAYSHGPTKDYLAWWSIKSLPKFNTQNPAVRQYLFSVARYWIERGADGWRLDVPNEIDDDSFWDEFRQIIKLANPNAYLVGEIWNADARWVGEGHFDGLLNYPFRDYLIRFLHSNTLTASQFVEKVNGLYKLYPAENASVMYNPLGSHDTERLLTKMEGNIAKARMAFFLQFSFPGAPGIYYGDEIGLLGDKDPGCRRAFPWDEHQWNTTLREWVKKLIWLRKNTPALRRGDFQSLLTDGSGISCAFARHLGEETVLVAVNSSSSRQSLRLPVEKYGWEDSTSGTNLIGGQKYPIRD